MPISRKYYTIRKITTGWLSHAIHSTDFSERIFRIFIELVLIIFFYFFVLYSEPFKIGSLSYALVSIVICHTIMWLLDGNFWVYMLDSFIWLKNPGIHKIISYVKLYIFASLLRLYFQKCIYILLHFS